MNPLARPVLLLNLCLAVAVIVGCSSQPEHVPDGYQLVYANDFDGYAGLQDFRATDGEAWRVGSRPDLVTNRHLELFGASDYRPTHRSPFNIALLSVGWVGSFVLDVDMQQSGREYGHRDLCVFFGFQDPDHFYYTHIATQGDQNAHQVFIVNDAPRTPITTERTAGVDWGTGWHHVRVMRDAEAGTVAVYFDDMDNPVQTASDTTFKLGYIGFGSFDDVGRMDNIRLWAPAMDDTPCEAFEPIAQ